MEEASSSSGHRIQPFTGQVISQNDDIEHVSSAILNKFDSTQFIEKMNIRQLEQAHMTLTRYRGFSDQVIKALAKEHEDMAKLEVANIPKLIAIILVS